METPPLDPGLTFVAQPDGRGGIAPLVRHADVAETLWIDARGAVSTYALTADADRSALAGIRVARAFTAHQHHELVRQAVGAATDRTGLVAAPNVAALYAAADGPDAETDRLFEATCSLLSGIADALAAPVLTSAPDAPGDYHDVVTDQAAHEITCRRTGLGYAFEAPGFTDPGYWQDGWWQTTIPYWVECCGAVDDPTEAASPDPVAVALE